jgi:hypothetical protein
MKLKTMQEIQQDLDDTFLPLEARGITGMRLIDGGLPEDTIGYFEERLGTPPWPADFKEFLKRYDFGRLELGLVHFCGNGQYLDGLIRFNSYGGRPPDLMLIASSDPHLILLNLKDGSVLALDNELGWEEAILVARTFELFMRGIGTLAEARARRAAPPSLASTVAACVGVPDSPYWLTWVR